MNISRSEETAKMPSRLENAAVPVRIHRFQVDLAVPKLNGLLPAIKRKTHGGILDGPLKLGGTFSESTLGVVGRKPKSEVDNFDLPTTTITRKPQVRNLYHG